MHPTALAPGEMLARMGARARPFLLESGSDADGCGAASYAGCDPVAVLEWSLGDAGDPFELLERQVRAMPCIAVGYLGYGLSAVVETRAPRRPDDRRFPDLSFGFYDAVWRHDRRTGRAEIIGPGARALRAVLEGPLAPSRPLGHAHLLPSVPEETYWSRLACVLEAIRAGEIYQMNLTHRLSSPWDGHPVALYEAVRRHAVPFGGLLDLGAGRALVANSPERFLRVRGHRIESRPIKGTAPATEWGRRSLAASEKEQAEHVMIVDLVRNDLGRVCSAGTIGVKGLGRIVAYPTLYHRVSTVEGLLRQGIGLAEILRATFPGGSVTGAPKVRAMQYIADLEDVPRGPYTGAFGRIGPARGHGLDLDLAMTIRTAACSPGWLDIGVGGGIVADSSPRAEWEETWLKARAWQATFAGGDERLEVAGAPPAG